MNLKIALRFGIAGSMSLLVFGSYLYTKNNGSSSMAIAGAASEATALRSAVRQSDYAFRGVVTKIEYRESDKGPGKEQLPHTFVTFKVEEALKGAKQDTVTLRFVGGPDSKGRTLVVSHVPLFDVGDRSILLVKDNGKSYCPLVGCDAGRFRIIKDKVYSNDGRSVTVNGKGEIQHGKPLLVKEVLEDKIGDKVFGSRHGKSTNDGDDAGQDASNPSPKSIEPPSMGQGQLSNFIRQYAGGSSARGVVTNVNSQDEFYTDAPKAVAPQPGAKSQALAPQPQNDQEREEIETLKRQQEKDLKTPLKKGR